MQFPKRPSDAVIAAVALSGIAVSLALRYALGQSPQAYDLPLYVVVVIGGLPLLLDLSRRLIARNFGSDLLAGVSIVSAVLLREYLVACIVILMLSGGEALESFATRRASSTLEALARRMPRIGAGRPMMGL